MTPFDAAIVAFAGRRDRRWMAAAIRHLLGRPTADDEAADAHREPGETVAHWVARLQPGRVRLSEQALIDEAGRQLAAGARLGLVPVAVASPAYPAILSEIPDPPALIWARGDVEACRKPGVAIVGSRAATPAGLEMARRLAHGLAEAGLVVTSGMARGIDSAAHVAALDAGGTTVAVLGSGLDRVYPPEHRALSCRIAEAGVLVSEFPPGVPPLAHHFPLRNRLVSGLVRAVVVVEAPEKSGALITAASALDQGRDVYAVPGAVPGGRNRGGHLLIRDGAKLIESADDILLELGLKVPPPTASSSEPEADAVLGRLPFDAEFSMDELPEAGDVAPGRVLARLLELELTGKIQRVGSGRFLRIRGRVLT